MAIDRNEFATECVDASAYAGVYGSLHYILAAAQFRSGISDEDKSGEIGPLRLIQKDWDAYRTDSEFEFNFISSDIHIPAMQCHVFALMVRRAQDRLFEKLKRYPSALELYLEQWPQTPLEKLAEGLTKAILETKGLPVPASREFFGEDLNVIELTDASSQPSELDSNGKIDESQLPDGSKKVEIARLILRKFSDEKFKFHHQVAALANAIAESNLNPAAHAGRGEDSWGLFQLNRKGGLGRGYDSSELIIPERNIEITIAAAKNARGFVKAGTLADAVSTFVLEVERPADKPSAIKKRTAIASRLVAAQA